MDRRRFLSTLSCSLAALPGSLPLHRQETSSDCWLDVVAPFLIEDDARGMRSEIILTSDTFAGVMGHADGSQRTDYEILLYDAAGKLMGGPGVTKRVSPPAMQTAAISAADLIGEAKGFWGGARIRLRPAGRELTHASDLFSSAFIRWSDRLSFDNVHANPDPRQWQNTERYFYSMPIPSLGEYECLYSLFNPSEQVSRGEIVLYDPQGKPAVRQSYELRPHASLLFDLNRGATMADPFASAEPAGKKSIRHHGLLAAINEQGTSKAFGYLMIRRRAEGRFSIEHPIHQGLFTPRPANPPFDSNNQFKARNVLYSPLLFKQKKVETPAGPLTLDSRFYFGTGLPLEEVQWLYPFAVDGTGNAVWSALNDGKLSSALPGRTERGVIRLAGGQSCVLDFAGLSLANDFAGGIGVAVSPETTHTLLKVELRIPEWKAFAFTHFRPGLRSARGYQKPRERGGLATDYIVSGARIVKNAAGVQFDELVAVINIDDQGIEGSPVLELFGPQGLLRRIPLGKMAPFACRHFLLSQSIKGEVDYQALSMRLVDERATLLMSTIHLDYRRKDLALDHGSDRFSTYLDYGCQ